nr:ribonuclease H-like domain-containing protein [Tanacetum cinerariifolium]
MGSKEETKRLKRKGLNLEKEQVKKQKSSEEAPEIETSTEEFSKEKIKEMMQEDLNQLWALVKEYLSIRPATSDKEMKLWVELKRMYEPDPEDQLWTLTQNFMHAPVEWKLYDISGVHHVTAKDKEIFMLVEKDYHLRKGSRVIKGILSRKSFYSGKLKCRRSIKFREGLLGIKCTRYSHCQDKGKGILVEEPKPIQKKQQVELDEAYTKKQQEEFNQDIDWEAIIDHVKQRAKEEPFIQRYQVMKKRPQTEAQAQQNMMMYLKNTAGFTLDYFKGMSYDDIRPIFVAKFNANMEFLLKSKEHIEEEESRAIATINETPAQKAAKGRKLIEEAKEAESIKQHLKIVQDEDDDVFTEATPLARKVVDPTLGNNKWYQSLLRSFDRKKNNSQVQQSLLSWPSQRMRTPIRVNRPNMNVAQPKMTPFAKIAHSHVRRPFQGKSVFRTQPRVPKVSTITKRFPTVDSTFSTAKSTFTGDLGNKGKGNSQNNIDDKGYWDSVCSQHMTGNISYLSNYKPYDGGYVSFEQGGGKITGKGHLNFKTMNKLARHNLVKDLPSKCFENDHTCVAFLKGKKHKASCKTKLVNYVSKPLHTLHMDLFGPTSVSSLNHKWYCLFVTDDFSRFTWTFFLKTKDETSGILRNFITEIENLKDLKAEAVNTACYVQNRVLVNKSHNKTSYELFNTRTPAIGFLKPFGCHVMILNTLDYLGKFDAKGDEGYFIGYSMFSKAFRVFNKRTKKVEENMHVDFLKNKLIEKGAGLNWLFDIFTLTNSMNCVSVVVTGTSSTNIAGTKDIASQAVKKDVSSLRYIALPNWFHEAHLESSTSNAQNACNVDAPESSGNFNPTATSKIPQLIKWIYQMDVKSAFLYGTINEEVYVMQPPGFQDPELSDKFIRGTIDQTPFIRKHRGDFLLIQVSANVPMDKENPWGKDGPGKDVELHLYRSMIGSLMYLTASRPDIMFAVYSDYGGATQDRKSTTRGCQILGRRLISWQRKKQTIVATSKTEAEYVAAASGYDNVADLLTKPFDVGRFQYLVDWGIHRILMISLRLILLIVDFVEASRIRYALTINPTVYVLQIRQFWSTARIEKTNEGTKILATVDGKPRTIFESLIRRNLKLNDEEGISSLPDAELFENLALMGYNILPNQKFTFQKGQFSHQWNFLIHTIMQFLSPKSISFNEFSSNIATAVVCLATNRVYKFLKMIFDEFPTLRQYSRRATRIAQSKALPTAADEHASLLRDDSKGEAFPTVSDLDAGQDRENIIKTSALPYDSTPRVTSLDADEGTQDLEISSLKARIKLLEDKDRGSAELSGDDAPIKGRSKEIGEEAGVEKITKRGKISTKDKGKEKMVESDMPKKKKLQEHIDVQVAREMEEEMAREYQRMNEQIARDAEIARIHAEEELKMLIDGLDRNIEMIAKHLHEYEQVAADLNIGEKIELINELKQLEDFVPMYSTEEGKRMKKKGLKLDEGSARKIKTSEDVSKENLKGMMQLVPVEEALVKETLSIRQASSDKEKELWVEMKRMFEPNFEDQLWTHTQALMHDPLEWKLYNTCSVHHVFTKDQEIFMLVERDYPLRRGLAIVMICNKLQVENYS